MPSAKFSGKSKDDLVIVARMSGLLTDAQIEALSQQELADFLDQADASAPQPVRKARSSARGKQESTATTEAKKALRKPAKSARSPRTAGTNLEIPPVEAERSHEAPPADLESTGKKRRTVSRKSARSASEATPAEMTADGSDLSALNPESTNAVLKPVRRKRTPQPEAAEILALSAAPAVAESALAEAASAPAVGAAESTVAVAPATAGSDTGAEPSAFTAAESTDATTESGETVPAVAMEQIPATAAASADAEPRPVGRKGRPAGRKPIPLLADSEPALAIEFNDAAASVAAVTAPPQTMAIPVFRESAGEGLPAESATATAVAGTAAAAAAKPAATGAVAGPDTATAGRKPRRIQIGQYYNRTGPVERNGAELAEPAAGAAADSYAAGSGTPPESGSVQARTSQPAAAAEGTPAKRETDWLEGAGTERPAKGNALPARPGQPPKANAQDGRTQDGFGLPGKYPGQGGRPERRVIEIQPREEQEGSEEESADSAENQAAAEARTGEGHLEADGGKHRRPAVESGDLVAGVLEIMPDGYGFLRKDNYLQGNKDIYVPPQYIRRFNLRQGDWITGPGKLQRETDRYQALLYIKDVNGMAPEKMIRRPQFDRLTPIYPDERYILETVRNELSTRIIDLVAPIGKGQRGMIVSPPKAGKTILLQKIANAISQNNPEVKLIVLLIDERPEEVTDMQRSINGEVVYSTFDKTPENHVKVTELVLERAMRLVELKQDVVILLDSMTRLARAYNLTINPTGRTLSGGLDPGALYGPKRFFGAARNIENGGSLTIIATSLIETGSRMDEVIFEEFKGTGNMEVYLDRKLSEKRIFPAIDINRSGTRREELLLSTKELDAVWTIRKAFSQLDTAAVTETIINLLLKTMNNQQFISSINVSFNDKNVFEAMRGIRPTGTGNATGGSGGNSGGYNSSGYGSNYRNRGGPAPDED